MDREPSFEDARLILQLYETRREDRMREARKWFAANFYCESIEEMTALCPPGSETNAFVRMVTSYWEMVGSFIARGVLNDELFFQSGQELLLTWTRVKPVIAGVRAAFGNPRYLTNLEEAGERYIAWWNRVAPGAYDSFVARIGVKPGTPAAAKS